MTNDQIKGEMFLTLISDGGYSKSSTNELPCMVEIDGTAEMPNGKMLIFVNGESLDKALGYDGVYSGDTWPFEKRHFMETMS